ncbi:MAG: histidine kinase dimerization/phospho-acceptor domain-containing protein [Planctomycetota bacterium]|jgi:two-component sensor histidine kinase
MDASRLLLCAVGLGLLLLAAAAFALVWGLQGQVMDEALEGQTTYMERHIREVVDRYAREVLVSEGGGLERFGERIRAAAEGNPAVLDLAVLDPNRTLVTRFTRLNAPAGPCAGVLPLEREANAEHPPGALLAESPAGCMLIPVYVGDQHRGAVLVHTMHDWLMESQRAGAIVRRTALRLAPIFLGFYLLLGFLLVAAGRAARRWRLRAAAAERVEALGAIADGINHEMRNPLNAVSLSLQLLGRQAGDDETREVVAEAQQQVRRIGATVEEFVRFTRVSKLDARRTGLAAIARAAAPGDTAVQGDADAVVDSSKLREALHDMCGVFVGVPQVRLEQDRAEWRVRVSGAVEGLDRGSLERLFEPYLRARPRDVGRGLALARAVFAAHGGELTAAMKGTTLTLRGRAPRSLPGETR